MKKIRKVLLIAFLFVSVFILSGCTNKKPITAENFYTTMKNKNYVLTDVTSQFSNGDNINKGYVAQNPDLTYQIEFYELKDVESAKKFYENNEKIFETSLGSVVTGKLNSNNKTVSKYRATSSGHYMALTRIENTVLFVRVAQDYSKEVSKIIKEIGY